MSGSMRTQQYVKRKSPWYTELHFSWSEARTPVIEKLPFHTQRLFLQSIKKKV